MLRRTSANGATREKGASKRHKERGSDFHYSIARKQKFEIMRFLHILEISYLIDCS